MAQYYPGEKPLLSLKYGTTTTPRTHSSDAKSLSTNAVATDMAIPSWLAERFANGAAALNLISTHTTIPVPRLKGWGRDHNGLCFFETERVLGSVRCDQTGDQCRMPQCASHRWAMQRLLGDRLFTRQQVCPGDGTSSTSESEKHYHGPEWVCASPTLGAGT